MFEFKLPDLGEGIHEAEVLQVKIKEGDTVKEDQAIFEVETDKAVVEIPCPVSGRVGKVHVSAGELVKVGTIMVSFGEGGADHAKAPAQTQDTAAKAAGGQKKEREQQAAGADLRAVGGAIAAPTMAPPAPTNGKSTHAATAAPAPSTGPVAAAPATRRLARELAVDLRLVSGSGPAGRISPEDVRSFAAGSLESSISGASSSERSAGQSAGSAQAPASGQSLASKYGAGSERDGEASSSSTFGAMTAQPGDLPDFSKYGQIERIPLKSIRKKIAQNMTMAWTHIPHVTTFDEADVTELDRLRAKHEDEVKKQGGRLTLTVFALKAIASALKKYPQFNASLDERSSELIFKHYINIGVAVATERGLIVPVIRDVDKKGIVQLCVELQELAEKTRIGKVELDRLQGGTFTLTNIGSIGGTSMSPMVNYPECAILGMARAAQKPVVRDGKIEIGLIMPLALSFDHRIADGAEAAYFVQHVVKRLQNPFTFLLEA